MKMKEAVEFGLERRRSRVGVGVGVGVGGFVRKNPFGGFESGFATGGSKGLCC